MECIVGSASHASAPPSTSDFRDSNPSQEPRVSRYFTVQKTSDPYPYPPHTVLENRGCTQTRAEHYLHVVNVLHVRSRFLLHLNLIIPVIWICESFKCPRSCSYFVSRITFRFLSIRRLRCCVLCSSATLRHQGAATCPAGALAVVYKERLHLSELPCPRSHLAVAAHCYRRRLAQVSLFVSISFVDITDGGGVHWATIPFISVDVDANTLLSPFAQSTPHQTPAIFPQVAPRTNSCGTPCRIQICRI